MNNIPSKYKQLGFSKVGEKKKCKNCNGDKWMMLMKDGGNFNVIYGDNTNNTGYLDKAPTSDNPYNVIPSGNITMEGVSKDVLAVKLDDKGQPIGMKFMKPDEDHKFEANSVMEIPKYQMGVYNAQYPMGGGDYYGTSPYVQQMLSPQNTVPMGEIETKQPTAGGIQNETQQPTEQTTQSSTPIMSKEEIERDAMQMEQDADIAEQESFFKENKAQFDKNQKNVINVEKDKVKDNNGQVFNPYGGVDIPTAAFTLGQSIENKDTLGTVGSSLKLVAGLGRNISSGLGQANLSREAMEEKARKDKESKIGEGVTMQKGGEYNNLTYDDIRKIDTISGVNFTSEAANNLFEKVPQNTEKNGMGASDLNLGKYGEVGYLQTTSNNDKMATIQNTEKYPYTRDSMEDMYKDIQKMNPNKEIKLDYKNFKGGGEFTDAELLTGEYITGVDQDNRAQMEGINSEVEAGEYYQTNQGDIAEVVGEKHSKEGEKMTMKEGDKVLTDFTKIGGDVAKYVSQKYDLDVKAKHTYSDVLDNFRKKIGLNKLVEQEESIIEKLDAQKNIKDRTTRDFNEKFLQQKLAEIQKKKEPIEEIRKVIYEDLFNIQESKTKTKDKEVEEMKNGGEYPKYQEGVDTDPLKAGKNENESGDISKTQKITDAEKSLAGVVTGENYVEYIAELMEQFPDYILENFDIVQGQDKIEDFVPKEGLDYKTAFGNIQNSIQGRYEDLIKEINASDLSKEEKEAALAKVNSEKFNDKEIAKKPDSILGGFTATRKNFKLSDFEKKATEKNDGDKIVTNGQKTETPSEDNTQKDSAYLIPDNYPIPPTGLEAHLKNTRRFDRLIAQQIDPEPFLENLRQEESSALQSLEGLSPNVAAAAAANISSNTQRNANEILNQIESQNLQARQNTDQVNTQTQRMEENARVQDNLSYEERQLTAKAKTDNDIRNYFNNSQLVNKQNFKDIQDLNLTNSLYDDIGFNGNGFYRKTQDKDTIKKLEDLINKRLKEQDNA